jgi:hypothetical protein
LSAFTLLLPLRCLTIIRFEDFLHCIPANSQSAGRPSRQAVLVAMGLDRPGGFRNNGSCGMERDAHFQSLKGIWMNFGGYEYA